MSKLFYILIKDPLSESLLGWCHSEDLENLRRAYPHLLMNPFPARLSEDEMNAGALYCGPEMCAQHASLMQMLQLHDNLAREKKEGTNVVFSINKRLLKDLQKRQEDEK